MDECDRVERRVVVLQRVVCALACVVVAGALCRTTNTPQPTAQPVVAIGLPFAPTLVAPARAQARARAVVRVPSAPAKAVTCPPGVLEFVYPGVCVLGSVIAFAWVGGTPLRDTSWTQHDQCVALVINAHHPRVVIPSQLGRMTRLGWIMSEDGVQGDIPSQVGFLTDLTFWHLTDVFVTAVPSQLGLLTALGDFNIEGGHVEGSIPSQFGALTQLERLSLLEMGLTGSIPSELGRLTKLQKLAFRNGFLTGSVPTQLGLLTLMTSFRIHADALEGTIPTQIGLLSAATTIEFRECRYSGSIPSQLGMLAAAEIMLVDKNELTGSIPSQLGKLQLLWYLRLDDNLLDGTVPTQLALLSNLKLLNISQNALSGTLPPLPDTVNVVCTHSGVDHPNCPRAPPRFVSDAEKWAVNGLAFALLLGLCALAVVVYVFRARPVIRRTSPPFTMLTLLSLGLAVASLIPFGETMTDGDRESRDKACQVMVYLGSQGMTLLLCCITVRNYPIWKIFVGNEEMLAVRVSMSNLLVPVGLNVLFTGALAAVITVGMEANEGFGCSTGDFPWLLYVLLAYILVLCIAATTISFQIRHTPSDFNDTQNIAKAMYNVSTFGTAMVCLSFVSADPTPKFLSLSLCVLLSVSAFVAVVHGCKLSRLGHQVAEERKSKSSSAARVTEMEVHKA